MSDDEFEGSPKTWPPLGLPTGSIRALLTLIVLAVVATKLIYGRPLESIWIETLLIALAHYFTSRRFVNLSPELLARLEAEGAIERERHPLYLPKNSIRTLIIGTFVGLTVYLYREQRLFTPEAIALLSMVFAYLLGAIFRGTFNFFRRSRSRPAGGSFGDVIALVVLISILVIAVPEVLGAGDFISTGLERIALGLTLFYFGSR